MAKQKRESACKRGYDRQWRNAKEPFLAENPTCCRCGEPSTTVDHDPPHGGDKEKFWDKTTWRALCKPCHDRKSVVQDGGFGNKVQVRSGPGQIADSLRSLAVPIGDVLIDPKNARKHPIKNLEAIKGSLTTFGQRKPIVCNRRTNHVEAGNGTLEAALALGWQEIAVVYVDDDPSTAAGFAIADNRSSELASWDTTALDALLREVQTGDERLQEMLAELAKDEGLYLTADGSGNMQPDEPTKSEEDWGEEDEDAFDLLFKAPFPWFGGKARIARMVWKHLGDVKGFVEPFFGSGAVMLNRPQPFEGVETINDADGLVCNFWRAVKADPAAVAEWADWPVNENDLHARHVWLVDHKEALQARLEGDPDWFDVKIAGWWCWGLACWIGGWFCSGAGPWKIETGEDGSRQLVHLSGTGQGVNRQLVHLSGAGRGVKRQLVHLSGAGRGVKRQLVHLADAGRGVKRKRVSEGNESGKAGLGECGLLAWMEALSKRLERVRVCCGDWTRVCGGKTGDALEHFFAAGEPCGIFLDPPYADTANRDKTLYRVDSSTVAHAVREWAIAHGDDKRLRIALCGYEGEHVMPKSWKCVAWHAQGGYGNQGTGQGAANRHQERTWFSPHCVLD